MRVPMPRTPKRRLGLRCEALLLLGAIWILMGCGVELGASRPPDGILFLIVPKSIRSTVWIVSGLWAMIAATRSDHTDSALGLLTVMPLFRLVSYLYAWVLWLHPGVDGGEYPDGWYQAGFYLVMVGFVFYVAHIPPALMRTFHSPDAERECARVAGVEARRIGGPRHDQEDPPV